MRDWLTRLVCRVFGHAFVPFISGLDANVFCQRCRRIFKEEAEE